ncbi:P-loop containing nucleoside triphosphate hydrolase protein [Cladochytrium replicatum]|nr:P-loop containing nucleoside triphosphate hydrolase protein [Cladochytrium replicatum]
MADNNGVDEVTSKVADLSTDAKVEDDEGDDVPVVAKHSFLVDTKEQEIEVKLADLEADAGNPLYTGVSTFEDLGLHPDLLKGLYSMGFTRPSKIQEKALPLLISNPPKNMIGQSQSGTGKTAAFVLTMLSRIDFSQRVPQAICLAPARELAKQIVEVVKEMGRYTPVTIHCAVKQSAERGQKITEQFIVGTPGTVNELIKRRSIDPSRVRIFVLDEADNMLDQQGLGDQSIRVKNQMPRNCQIVLFSATFPPVLRDFATKFAPRANMISLKQEELSVEGIKQFYMDCKDEEHKAEVLCEIYGILTIGQSIIFVRKREVVDQLEQRLKKEGHAVVALHGGHQPTQRDQIMSDFREGKSKVLITTNVLSRGIDILQVTLVINYDIPLDAKGVPDPETYLHRIGRTGRFGRQGVSINFVHDRKSYEEMMEIERHFEKKIERVPTNNINEIEKMLKKFVKG